MDLELIDRVYGLRDAEVTQTGPGTGILLVEEPKFISQVSPSEDVVLPDENAQHVLALLNWSVQASGSMLVHAGDQVPLIPELFFDANDNGRVEIKKPVGMGNPIMVDVYVAAGKKVSLQVKYYTLRYSNSQEAQRYIDA